ncbi:DUF4157 domain-containing protein [Streptomyces sp. NPDC047000]|uniref:eCIS core domain-containing protein n=1 Tax=Streptomyces sp. NPDC047000 TaxID=3155474 RepID=UPI0033F79CAF
MHAQEDRARVTGPIRSVWSPVALSASPGPQTAGGSAAGRMLTLQRLAGNAAVARAVAAGRDPHAATCGPSPVVQRTANEHQHDAGCGHVPQVQRRALVNEVVKSPGEQMDAGLRSEMEARFHGADFSGVRVHTNALARESARELQAKAYTSGPNIVVGGSLSKEDWAHELTHYNDQLAGPVPGTDNGAGARVSSEGDSGERHAVDNARRVMSGPVPAVQRTEDDEQAP